MKYIISPYEMSVLSTIAKRPNLYEKLYNRLSGISKDVAQALVDNNYNINQDVITLANCMKSWINVKKKQRIKSSKNRNK